MPLVIIRRTDHHLDYISVSLGSNFLIKIPSRAGFKYVLSNTNTNTSFQIFQIQIQIQIRWNFFFKYKYKYKYEHSNTNTNTNTFKILFKYKYSESPIYRGRVYRGIGYIAVACWTPFFWRPRARYFSRIILINVIIFVAYVLNLLLNTQRSHSRSQRAGKWSLILAQDRRPIYCAPT